MVRKKVLVQKEKSQTVKKSQDWLDETFFLFFFSSSSMIDIFQSGIVSVMMRVKRARSHLLCWKNHQKCLICLSLKMLLLCKFKYFY